jgi:dTDP-4-dehydrorhamnose reductase
MHIAVIGQTGQLARALISRASDHGVSVESYSRDALDFTQNANTIEAFIDGLKVDAIIIAAAYTAVDKAESDYETAKAVNALAPSAIARACARRDIPLVYVSTDYVFKGDATTPYTIGARTDPINAYGRSKLAGEQAVMRAHNRAVIIRTSWVFDGMSKNFMTTMLRLAETRESLSVVSDQIGRPTYAGHLADSCFEMAKAMQKSADLNGIYHVSGSGAPISWSDFARAIFMQAQDILPHTVTVNSIPSTDYPTPAPRPAYSVLDISKYEAKLSALPNWREGLELAYKEWSENRA